MLDIENEITYSADASAKVYGEIESGPNVGRVVLFNGGLVRNFDTGEIIDSEPVVGIIIGYNHNQVLIGIDGGFLGWVKKYQYRILNFCVDETNFRTVH